MRTFFGVCLVLTSLICGLVVTVNATLLTGAINDIPEAGVGYYWGDGINDLNQRWFTKTIYPEGSGVNLGWFFGSDDSYSNVDIFVYNGLTDLSTIVDSTVFSYLSTGGIIAGEGDTIFFRGVNGYYGAWRIDDIYTNPAGFMFPYTYLSGQWYFQDDGTGNFSNTSPVPEPATVLLFGIALIGFAVTRIARKRKLFLVE
jgi:PEP-CTERM motif